MSKRYKYLNIKGTVLDNEQLQNYMEKIASNHDIKLKSKKYTYPIPRFKENFKFIKNTYNLLNEHVKMDIGIIPSGEWLLDNFYLIEETASTVIKEMTLKKYEELPGLASGMHEGFSRVHVLAEEIVAYTDAKIDDDVLLLAISSYQRRKLLSQEEIWNICLFLQISIVENIRNICEKIYFAQLQKYKVENIIERLVEDKDKKEYKYSAQKSTGYTNNVINYTLINQMKYPFIEHMSYKLKQYGKQGLPYLNILENEVNKMGMTVSEVIKKEHFDIAVR